ncbi:three-helix bundle dimerization domain-containing protein [Streptomyces sp. NPDC048723]|uniref:three-helix bundle dimerization domain-containing protein n=1 Tax=unclassified Streptomyces TaxID=2593676 RepID=UPI000ACDBA89
MTETEDVLIIHHVAERLLRSHPGLDTATINGAVQTAYDEFRYARVRTYLPVLLERRAQDLLPSGKASDRSR